MHIDFDIADSKAVQIDWNRRIAEVNTWRGACLHHISLVEMAVTETLLLLSAVSADKEAVRLRHLIGQRLEDLAAAIGQGGPFSEPGTAAYAALSSYRANHEAFRTLLCHGVVKVAVDQHGQWLLVIRTLTIRASQSERGLTVIDQAEAAARLAALKRDGRALASKLGQLQTLIC